MKPNETFALEEIALCKRLASLVTASYKIRFKPKDLTDYIFSVSVSSEGETFPIYILGNSGNIK